MTRPVASVERATASCTPLGWTLDTEMSDDDVSCSATAPGQHLVLGTREMHAGVGGAEEPVGGPDTPSEVTVSSISRAARRSTTCRARSCRRRALG